MKKHATAKRKTVEAKRYSVTCHGCVDALIAGFTYTIPPEAVADSFAKSGESALAFFAEQSALSYARQVLDERNKPLVGRLLMCAAGRGLEITIAANLPGAFDPNGSVMHKQAKRTRGRK